MGIDLDAAKSPSGEAIDGEYQCVCQSSKVDNIAVDLGATP
jgi:hypothetical protein